jgi:alpha-galactosidase
VSGAQVRLTGGGQSLVLDVANGVPSLIWWGEDIGEADARVAAALAPRAVPHGMLDGGEALDLSPTAARGFTGFPALEIRRGDGTFLADPRLVTVEATPHDARLTLEDVRAGLRLVLTLALDPATGVAAFASRLENTGATVLGVDWLAAIALPLDHDEALLFDGRWAAEMTPVRARIATGAWIKDNRTGRTSHHAPPFAVVGQPGFDEDHGEVMGLHLAWSGSSRVILERLRDGRLQVQAGELFLPGEMNLEPGEAYETPTLYAARDAAGLNGLSARLHPFVRQTILGGRLAARPRPVTFNTWEAVYFRHDLETLKDLAAQAAALGVERFVLDDGWFVGRDDDTTSLGDWRADPLKYPQGLTPLIDHVRSLGMAFGLWVEPEMANRRSALLEAHPDWVLGDEGRAQPLGRGQYVLDLSRPEVAEAIFAQLDALLSAHPIAYLKWDMNRDLTHPASRGRPAVHAQTRAVYALIDRLRAAHPAVEIESCASGGGRADYEILKRSERIWTSDNNDPTVRQKLHRTFSIFFPPEVMGAHVAAATNPITGARSGMTLRAATALFGHMGVEADVRTFSEAERATLARMIALHKSHRARLHGGRLVRLSHPEPGLAALMAVDPEGALVSAVQLDLPRTASPAPLRLAGLEEAASWRVRLLNPSPRPEASMKRAPALADGAESLVPGRVLAQAGLPLPVLPVGGVALFALERVG